LSIRLIVTYFGMILLWLDERLGSAFESFELFLTFTRVLLFFVQSGVIVCFWIRVVTIGFVSFGEELVLNEGHFDS
jgi:hypothetical protein